MKAVIIVIVIALTQAVFGQELTTAYDTGDAEMDCHLTEINESA